ncbi:Flp family type IVb pilin [Flavimaricola marinus]|uniref:Flp/Fap pilin component n=1 Tax=Flavimaricola marinus TaxID=1819565 RepID=A0A238L956_9RHOB|nr:Flp family type IVb pilin [Flavimaricola marinus]SMY06131.1 hypothetical protein LOM8899_00252 [Flavimaricola marinus]
MARFTRSIFKRFLRDQQGVTLVEYGIALMLATTVGAFSLMSLGDTVSAKIVDAGQFF